MIPEFIARFDKQREALKAQFTAKAPESYKDIVQAVVEAVGGSEEVRYKELTLDPGRITEISHGHYQGTLLYIIAERGYQPSTYYFTKVDYGSCAGCDALEAIHDYGRATPEQVGADVLTLALHILQNLKEIP